MQLLELVLATISDAIVITDIEPLDEPGPRIVYVNPAFERMSGYRADEVIGKSPRILQGPLTDANERTRIRRALEQRQPVRSELINYSKTGEPYWIELDIVPASVGAAASTHFISVQRDITARKEVEAQRLADVQRRYEQQRLESIGLLARGIAHDFNNLLTTIQGRAELTLLELPARHPVCTDVEAILSATERAADLVNQILLYTGKEPQHPEPVALDHLINDTSSLFATSVGQRGKLICQIDDDLPLIEADPTQIRQVMMNLLFNAADALDNTDGCIRLIATADELDMAALQDYGAIDHARPGPYVRLSISDTGAGMDDETRRHIFEPFFTTKIKGHGLGLATVASIVRAHKGMIRVESSPGQGTRFDVWFPTLSARTVDEPLLDQHKQVLDTMQFLHAAFGYTETQTSKGTY